MTKTQNLVPIGREWLVFFTLLNRDGVAVTSTAAVCHEKQTRHKKKIIDEDDQTTLCCVTDRAEVDGRMSLR